MGASQGKTKNQQKEEARQWAETKDIEVVTLYGDNTKLMNELRILQAEFQAMKRTIDQQQIIIENMTKENAAISRRFEEKLDECCPTTQEAHDAELQRMFDEEWELVLSSHASLSAQARYMPGGKLDWTMLDDKGLQAVKILQLYGGILTGGQIANEVEEMRKRHDLQVKGSKELFKFEGNHFKSVAKVLFRFRNGFASMPFHS
jgi:hypothetical protein